MRHRIVRHAPGQASRRRAIPFRDTPQRDQESTRQRLRLGHAARACGDAVRRHPLVSGGGDGRGHVREYRETRTQRGHCGCGDLYGSTRDVATGSSVGLRHRGGFTALRAAYTRLQAVFGPAVYPVSRPLPARHRTAIWDRRVGLRYTAIDMTIRMTVAGDPRERTR